MSPSTPQPNHAATVIQEFLEWVPKHCINGTSGPSTTPNHPFMPLRHLEAYLKAESRTTKILRALFERDYYQVDVDSLESQYIRVFTILTLIGKGTYIERVVEFPHLRDSQLPFLKRPCHFPIDPNDSTFWDQFYEKQFAFCPHYFRLNESSMLEDPYILPIISKEALAQGGSAAIYKIKLHPLYDQLNPASDVPEANRARPANTYVLKTYNTKDAHDYYRNEVDAFKKLTEKPTDQSLIKFLGAYKQGDIYNILLEYADCGTLEDYFQTVSPPSLGEDIIRFWKGLLNVIKALSRIHEIERPNSFQGPDVLIGFHQDVKPSNILVLSGKNKNKNKDPYDVEFKLADLGLSHFKRTVKLGPRIGDSDVGGTKDYGAPECHRSSEFFEQTKVNINPLVDIWSFGGVCSEAAVWVVLGKSGLMDYRDRRKQEICDNRNSQDGSCFHDGEKVLHTVKAMHDRLLKKGEVRPADHVTFHVVEMIEGMLEENPRDRLNANQLYSKSIKILTKAQSKLQESNQQTPLRHVDSMAYILDMASRPVHGRPKRGATSHIRQANPTVNNYPAFEEQPETGATAFHETATGHGAEGRQSFNHRSYSSANGSRDITPESQSVLGQGTHGYSPPETEPGARFYRAQPLRSDARSAPAPLQNIGAFGSSSQSNPQHSNVASTSTSYEEPHVMTGTTSGEASRRSPSKTPPLALGNTTAAEPPAQKTNPVRPYLSYKEVKVIRERRDDLSPQVQNSLNCLKVRDHVFLMDDSLSMEPHWNDVISLFSVLAYLAKNLDNNRLEMYFTVSDKQKTFKDTTPAVSHLKKINPNTYSNIDLQLDQILRSYQTDLQRQNEPQGYFRRKTKKVKPLSLYVFTDAAWPGGDAVAPVEAMIEKLQQLRLSRAQVAIQFIRFGNDPTGIKRLEYLDSGLRKKHTKKWYVQDLPSTSSKDFHIKPASTSRDIVDTEPFEGGNVLKMLLGAVDNWFDDDPD
ncbi:hypothetical protein MMC22_011266 [Lobaria immixta]|nr:hypothetical protein [Lobaria immixta]